MENGEVKLKGKDTVGESGYSEERLDQSVDLHAGQWLDLQKSNTRKPISSGQKDDKGKKTSAKIKKVRSDRNRNQQKIKKEDKTIQDSSISDGGRDTKIISAIDQINGEIQTKIELYLQEIVSDLAKADETLREIIEYQTMQKALLQALKWEMKGTLDTSKLSKQVQNLLK